MLKIGRTQNWVLKKIGLSQKNGFTSVTETYYEQENVFSCIDGCMVWSACGRVYNILGLRQRYALPRCSPVYCSTTKVPPRAEGCRILSAPQNTFRWRKQVNNDDYRRNEATRAAAWVHIYIRYHFRSSTRNTVHARERTTRAQHDIMYGTAALSHIIMTRTRLPHFFCRHVIMYDSWVPQQR